MAIYFSKEHEWIKTDGSKAFVGITTFAANALGDIVYVELPKTGSALSAGKAFGSVESVKAVSDMFSPVSGKVLEVNTALDDAPELLNADAMANHILVLEMSNEAELSELMDEAAYNAYCEKEA